MASWRTTLLGIATILSGVIWIIGSIAGEQPAGATDFATAIAAITAGTGLVTARDSKDVTPPR